MSGAPAGRRAARERALELLYEAETKGESPDRILADLPVPPDEYAVAVLEGVAADAASIDAVIAERAPAGWPMERMPALDRALLRMGIFELRARPDVPTAVVLAEAVALAQEFSTDDSARFVNGLLARVAEQTRGDRVDPSSGAPRGDEAGGDGPDDGTGS